MTKVYLAGGISDTDRFEGQKRTARQLRQRGCNVYAAAENDSINDKSNDPEPIDIYNGDINKVKESDIFIARLSGGNEDGTISEIGMVSGWNERLLEERMFLRSIIHLEYEDMIEAIERRIEMEQIIEILVYITNSRIMQPQFYKGVPSAKLNHLVLGMVDRWGKLLGDEDDMLRYMKGVKQDEKTE